MTTYTAIPNTDIDADSPINTSLMTKLRDNPIAITEGASGAPNIQTAAYTAGSVDQAAIGSGAVHQGELDTGTEEETSSSAGCPGSAGLTINNGAYAFFPEIKTTGTASSAGWCVGTNSNVIEPTGSSYGAFNFNLFSGNAIWTAYLRVRYINSSPPYDFGDGQVGRFVYAEMAPNGDVVRSWNADDPPWHYEIIRGELRQDRKAGKVYIRRPTVPMKRWADVIGKQAEMDAYVEALKNLEWQWVELTNADKLAPMAKRSRPWAEKADQANTQIIIDPVSPVIQRIQEMMDADNDVSPSALLHEGYLRIDNTSMQRKGPPGVAVHGVRWK